MSYSLVPGLIQLDIRIYRKKYSQINKIAYQVLYKL